MTTAAAHPISKMPRDPAITDPIHPGCRPAHLIPDASFDHLVAYLTQYLGAAGIRPTERTA